MNDLNKDLGIIISTFLKTFYKFRIGIRNTRNRNSYHKYFSFLSYKYNRKLIQNSTTHIQNWLLVTANSFIKPLLLKVSECNAENQVPTRRLCELEKTYIFLVQRIQIFTENDVNLIRIATGVQQSIKNGWFQ